MKYFLCTLSTITFHLTLPLYPTQASISVYITCIHAYIAWTWLPILSKQCTWLLFTIIQLEGWLRSLCILYILKNVPWLNDFYLNLECWTYMYFSLTKSHITLHTHSISNLRIKINEVHFFKLRNFPLESSNIGFFRIYWYCFTVFFTNKCAPIYWAYAKFCKQPPLIG